MVIFSESSGDFTLKFSSKTTDKITIKYKDSQNEYTKSFKYNDNWSSWGPLSDTTYSKTNRIYGQLNLVKYNYVHICQVEQPTFCDTSTEALTPPVELEEQVVLTCEAVGPAPLSAEWTSDTCM